MALRIGQHTNRLCQRHCQLVRRKGGLDGTGTFTELRAVGNKLCAEVHCSVLSPTSRVVTHEVSCRIKFGKTQAGMSKCA